MALTTKAILLGSHSLTVLRIKVPPNTALHWHHHPVISVGYVLSGELTLEKKATGERTIVHPGQALAETVQTTHRGFTTNEPVDLVVFYARHVVLPININEDLPSAPTSATSRALIHCSDATLTT